MRKSSLPPLTTLRGFKSAARHLSFTLAAAELNVTQGAISRQIRQLEKALGVALFRRLIRRLELTPEGEEYYQTIKGLFAELERAGARFQRRKSASILTISALPTIASHWLMPRLHQFAQVDGQVEIYIVSSIAPMNFLERNADIAIRVGRLPGRRYDLAAPRIELEMVTSWTGVTAEELFPDVLVPVCTPRFLEHHRLHRHADLANVPLIHTATRRFAWPDWLRAHGVTKHDGDSSLEFGHFFMALEAARKHQGVALVPEILLTHYAGADEFVRPFAADLPSAGEYYLLIPEQRLSDPSIQAFRRWIISEVKSLRPEIAHPFEAEGAVREVAHH